MPHFNKKETELTTRLDEWLYFIKNLEDFQSVPSFFKDHVFEQAFEKAEIAKYSEEEKNSYQQSLKIFRDNKATYDYAKETAYDEGRTEGEIAGKIEGKIAGKIEGKIEGKIAGIIEGKIEIAKKLKSKGMDIDFIIETTGLSENEINSL